MPYLPRLLEVMALAASTALPEGEMKAMPSNGGDSENKEIDQEEGK